MMTVALFFVVSSTLSPALNSTPSRDAAQAQGQGLEQESEHERDRVQSHLRLVEQLLRERAVALDDSQRRSRSRGLDALRRYLEAGVFPRNLDRPGRAPVFIDERGVPCAVAHLIIDSGRPDLAEGLRQTQNNRWLDTMVSDELSSWVATSGFSLDELRLIQPSYRYETRFEDPLLEAAYLCDTKKVLRLLDARGANQQTLDLALRAVAPNANWDTVERKVSVGVSYEAPPRTENGIPLVRALLKRGANPNSLTPLPPRRGRFSGDIQPVARSIVFDTKDPEVRAILVKAGGRLTDHDRLIEAVEAGDGTAVKGLLDVIPQPEPGALCAAYENAWRNDVHVIRVLLDSKRFDVQAECPRYVMNQVLVRPVLAVEVLSRGFALRDQYHWDTVARAVVGDFDDHRPRLPRSQLDTLVVALEQQKALATTSTVTVSTVRHTARLQAFVAVMVRIGLRLEPGRQLAEALSQLDEKPLTPMDATRIHALVTLGADLNADAGGLTPVGWAVLRRDPSLLSLLLARGAAPNSAPSAMCPPLAMAIENDDAVVVSLLLAHQADPAATYDRGPGSCVTPQRQGGYAFEVAPISSMTMSPAIKDLLATPPASIDVAALNISAFTGADTAVESSGKKTFWSCTSAPPTPWVLASVLAAVAAARSKRRRQ
jgi:hypothetical protein